MNMKNTVVPAMMVVFACGTASGATISVPSDYSTIQEGIDAAEGYHLTAGSPCIDAGTTVEIDADMDGEARPEGDGFDMGADEYLDLDGDGWSTWDDCDEADPGINPGVLESRGAGNCEDGIDNDCDGSADTDPECGGTCFLCEIL